MKIGTLKFKKDVRLVGEPTIGNERNMRFSKKKLYDVAISPESLASAFVDVHFIKKAWVQGISRELFTFTKFKKSH
jgi:hypothetical protein